MTAPVSKQLLTTYLVTELLPPPGFSLYTCLSSGCWSWMIEYLGGFYFRRMKVRNRVRSVVFTFRGLEPKLTRSKISRAGTAPRGTLPEFPHRLSRRCHFCGSGGGGGGGNYGNFRHYVCMCCLSLLGVACTYVFVCKQQK